MQKTGSIEGLKSIIVPIRTPKWSPLMPRIWEVVGITLCALTTCALTTANRSFAQILPPPPGTGSPNFAIAGTGSSNFQGYPTTDGTHPNPSMDRSGIFTILGWPGQTTPINYSTSLPETIGPEGTRLRSLWVDPVSGDIFFGGGADGYGVATTPGVLQPDYSGSGENGLLCRYSATGVKKWCTYLGPNPTGAEGAIYAIGGLDPDGNIIVAGYIGCMENGDLLDGTPITHLGPACPAGAISGFAAKIKGDGTAIVWLTEWSGAANNGAQRGRMVVDSSGFIYGQGDGLVAGDFPVTPGVFQPNWRGGSGGQNSLVYKLKPDGSGFVW